MIKKIQITSLMMLILVVVVSCAPKPVTTPVAPVEEPEAPPEVDVTGESSVDEVAEDISASVDTDEELDTSELVDIDDILAEIENI